MYAEDSPDILKPLPTPVPTLTEPVIKLSSFSMTRGVP